MTPAELTNLVIITLVAVPVLDATLGGTTLGPIHVDRRAARMLYPRLWWLGPGVMLVGGIAVLVLGSDPLRAATGAIVVLAALTALTRFTPPAAPVDVPRWVARLRRGGTVTDTRRWARLVLVLVASAVLLADVAVRSMLSVGR